MVGTDAHRCERAEIGRAAVRCHGALRAGDPIAAAWVDAELVAAPVVAPDFVRCSCWRSLYQRVAEKHDGDRAQSGEHHHHACEQPAARRSTKSLLGHCFSPSPRVRAAAEIAMVTMTVAIRRSG